jgi:hypothetical protein
MRRLGVIILGASKYDHWKSLDNPRFAESAKEFRELLTDEAVIGKREVRVLSLFDEPHPPDKVTIDIINFLSEAEPDDVVLYYCGHGDLTLKERREYFVYLRGTQNIAIPATALKISDLAENLERYLIGKRVFVVLDACFAGSGIVAWVNKAIVATALAATEGRDIALARTGDPRTVFTGAIADVLRNGIATRGEAPQLSWRDVFEHVYKVTQEQQAPTPRMLQTRGPEGDVSEIPFFINKAYHRSPPPKSGGPLDALRAETFDNAFAPHCVVVTAEASDAPGLVRHVRLAVDSYSSEIEQAARAFQRRRNLGVVLQDKADDEPALVQSRLDVTKAFTSPEAVEAAVRALCRAEVAVFDITNLQPGIMFLLGVRSVARRGVTICSYGGSYVHGQGLQLPFNLQMLNVAAHSNAQVNSSFPPSDIIGRKIWRGLREIDALPDYMDLPAYDPVRTFGASSESFKSIPRSNRVLVLCPFSPAYEFRNWRPVLQQELSAKLKLRGRGERSEVGRSRGAESGPLLVRLLDLETPRLVVQTLYELIRRVDMCVVDWTDLRPNVMFELGVRLAVNRLGAIHIVAAAENGRDDNKDNESPNADLIHVRDMSRLFRIIEYSCENPVGTPFQEMVQWFDQGLRAGNTREDVERYRKERQMDFLIYEAIGAAVGSEPQAIWLPLVQELTERARLLSSEEEESTGTSSILYQDVSPALRARAEEAAIDRRIAAWLYIDAHYTDDEIADDAQLLREFRALGAQILRWFNKQRELAVELPSNRRRLEERIKERARARLRLVRSKGGPSN